LNIKKYIIIKSIVVGLGVNSDNGTKKLRKKLKTNNEIQAVIIFLNGQTIALRNGCKSSPHW
jgi:hypothetical protein